MTQRETKLYKLSNLAKILRCEPEEKNKMLQIQCLRWKDWRTLNLLKIH